MQQPRRRGRNPAGSEPILATRTCDAPQLRLGKPQVSTPRARARGARRPARLRRRAGSPRALTAPAARALVRALDSTGPTRAVWPACGGGDSAGPATQRSEVLRSERTQDLPPSGGTSVGLDVRWTGCVGRAGPRRSRRRGPRPHSGGPRSPGIALHPGGTRNAFPRLRDPPLPPRGAAACVARSRRRRCDIPRGDPAAVIPRTRR